MMSCLAHISRTCHTTAAALAAFLVLVGCGSPDGERPPHVIGYFDPAGPSIYVENEEISVLQKLLGAEIADNGKWGFDVPVTLLDTTDVPVNADPPPPGEPAPGGRPMVVTKKVSGVTVYAAEHWMEIWDKKKKKIWDGDVTVDMKDLRRISNRECVSQPPETSCSKLFGYDKWFLTEITESYGQCLGARERLCWEDRLKVGTTKECTDSDCRSCGPPRDTDDWQCLQE